MWEHRLSSFCVGCMWAPLSKNLDEMGGDTHLGVQIFKLRLGGSLVIQVRLPSDRVTCLAV